MYRDYTIKAANNKGADQTVRRHRLICSFVVCIGHKQVFSRCGSNKTNALATGGYVLKMLVEWQTASMI